MLVSLYSTVLAAMVLSPPAMAQNTSVGSVTNTTASGSTIPVIQLDQVALNALPVPFTSRNFSSPYYVASNGSALSLPSPSSSPSSSAEQVALQISNEALARPLLGPSPTLTTILYEPGYAFAHEAPVYFPDTDDVYLCSNAGGALGRSNLTTNNRVFRFNLGAILSKLDSGEPATFEADVSEVQINSDDVQMTNGGTNYNGSLLLANSGRTASLPGNLALVNRTSPTEVRVLVNNAAGRQFNSPNDVAVSPRSGAVFFTDAWYGRTQGFRPTVDTPAMVWRLDPRTGELTPLTDPSTVANPNGLAFNPDGTKLYVSNTSPIINGTLPPEASRAASIYEFDVLPAGRIERLANQRLFAWPWTAIADGIKVDARGNVYAGTGDGLQVWSREGEQVFRLFVPETGVVNLVFAREGRVVLTAEEKVYLVQLDRSVEGVPLEEFPRSS